MIEELRRKPNPEVIEKFEEMLELAKAGRINSALILAEGWGEDGTPEVSNHGGGRLSVPDYIFAFECWKLKIIPLSEVE